MTTEHQHDQMTKDDTQGDEQDRRFYRSAVHLDLDPFDEEDGFAVWKENAEAALRAAIAMAHDGVRLEDHSTHYLGNDWTYRCPECKAESAAAYKAKEAAKPPRPYRGSDLRHCVIHLLKTARGVLQGAEHYAAAVAKRDRDFTSLEPGVVEILAALDRLILQSDFEVAMVNAVPEDWTVTS